MTEIMESSKRKNEIYDSVRKKWVEKTPEEFIRQKILVKMVKEMGYPSSHLAVEIELSHFPHLIESNLSLPRRRIDIAVFAKDLHPDFSLYPLLLIECKAETLQKKFARQLLGYNYFVKAPFVALANSEEILTGYFDENTKDYQFKNGLPSYPLLIEQAAFKRPCIFSLQQPEFTPA